MLKSIIGLFLVVMSTTASAQIEQQNASARKVETSETRFKEFYRMRSTKFHGRAQGLSMFNLDLEMVIHYNEPILDGRPYTFSFASNGNIHIAGVPVFPVAGQIKYEVPEITDGRGNMMPYKIDGEPVQLTSQLDTIYMVESDAALADRVARISALNTKGDNRYEKAKGRMIAIVKFDLFSQKIRFYQIDQSTGDLLQSGVFEGKVR